MHDTRDLYKILQVDTEAEPEVIEAAYRRLARKYHPDVSAAAGAVERMQELNAAYQVLRDPARRAAYDAARAVPPVPEAAEPAPAWPEQPASSAATGWSAEGWSAEGWSAATGWAVCREHPEMSAAASCVDCGAGLCEWCADRAQPPTCAACILDWARERRRDLLPPLAAGAAIFAAVYGVLVWLYAGQLGLSATLPAAAVPAYWAASLPLGWRLLARLAPDAGGAVRLVLAIAVGPVAAPFQAVRAVWELRQVRRLEASAGAGR